MLVSFANNQTMVADQSGGPAVITTDPLPVGDANNLFVVMTIHHFVAMGAAAPNVSFIVQQSNDGQEWLVTTITAMSAALGPVQFVGPLTAVFIRFQITHNTNGDPGDWSAATFDIHGNLKHI